MTFFLHHGSGLIPRTLCEESPDSLDLSPTTDERYTFQDTQSWSAESSAYVERTSVTMKPLLLEAFRAVVYHILEIKQGFP